MSKVSITGISKPKTCKGCWFNNSDYMCEVTHGTIDRDDYTCDKPCPMMEEAEDISTFREVECIFCGNIQKIDTMIIASNKTSVSMFCDKCGSVQAYFQLHGKRIKTYSITVNESEEL